VRICLVHNNAEFLLYIHLKGWVEQCGVSAWFKKVAADGVLCEQHCGTYEDGGVSVSLLVGGSVGKGLSSDKIINPQPSARQSIPKWRST
jgi:hypothetical protein